MKLTKVPKEVEKQIIKTFKLFNQMRDIQTGASDIEMGSDEYKKLFKEYEKENDILNEMRVKFERADEETKAFDVLQSLFNKKIEDE